MRSANTLGSATDFPDDRVETWEMTASTGSIAIPSNAVTFSEAVEPEMIAWLCCWKL